MISTILWSTVPQGGIKGASGFQGKDALKLSVVASPCPSLNAGGTTLGEEWLDWSSKVLNDGTPPQCRLQFFLQFATKDGPPEKTLIPATWAPEMGGPAHVDWWQKLFPQPPVQGAGEKPAKSAASPSLATKPRPQFAGTYMSYSSLNTLAHVKNHLVGTSLRTGAGRLNNGLGLDAATFRAMAASTIQDAIQPWIQSGANETTPAQKKRLDVSQMVQNWISVALKTEDPMIMSTARRLERNLYRLSTRPWTTLEGWALANVFVEATKELTKTIGGEDAIKKNDILKSEATKHALHLALFYGRVNESKKPATDPGKEPPPDLSRKILMLNNHPTLMEKLGLIFKLQAVAPTSLANYCYVRVCVARDNEEFGWSPWTRIAPQPDVTQFYSESSDAAMYGNGKLLPGKDSEHLSVDSLAGSASMLKIINHLHSSDDSNAQDHSAAPHSHGISVYWNERAKHVGGKIDGAQARFKDFSPGTPTTCTILNTNASLKVTQPDLQPARVQTFSDLVRGYVPFVYLNDASTPQPLSMREEKFLIGGSLKDSQPWAPRGEHYGCVSTSTTTTHDTTSGVPTDDNPDLHTHEAIFTWDGRSLGAPHGLQPAKLPDCTKNSERTRDHDGVYGPALISTYRPLGLPKLRFGTTYRFAIPCMDIAGGFRKPMPGEPTLDFEYVRYDPVPPPEVLLMKHLSTVDSPGEQLTNLVIRSDAPGETTGECLRVLVPPACSIDLAERCGMFDNKKPHHCGSFDQVRLVDGTAQFPIDYEDGGNHVRKQNPIYQSPAWTFRPCQYLPDPYAAGIQLVVTNTSNSADTQTLRAPYYSSGKSWPHADALALAIVPQQDHVPTITTAEENRYHHGSWFRTIVVRLPKGCATDINLTSYLHDPDSNHPHTMHTMAVFHLAKNFMIKHESPHVQGLAKDTAKISAAFHAASVSPMTPARILNAVHATPKPLAKPQNPEPTPETRNPGQTSQAFKLVAIDLHLATTAKLAISSLWQEWLDSGPGTSAPTTVPKSAPVFNSNLDLRQIQPDAPKDKLCLTTVTFDAGTNPVTQQFPDTRYRAVRYIFTGTGRMATYFRNQDNITLSGEPFSVGSAFLNSAVPPLPDVAYIAPTFKWLNILPDGQESSGYSRVRKGGGCRIWLKRPWYCTGECEMLGIVIWADSFAAAGEAGSKDLATRWGSDPLWDDHAITHGPAWGDFEPLNGTALCDYPGNSNLKIVALPPNYDPGNDLWFVDVRFRNIPSYFSFLRFSLVRFQEHSIDGCKISPVVQPPFTQLLPNRAVSVTRAAEGKLSSVLLDVVLSDPSLALSRGKSNINGGSTYELLLQRPRTPAETRNFWLPAERPDSGVTGDAEKAELRRWQVSIPRDDHGATRVSVYEYENFVGEADYPATDKPDSPILKCNTPKRRLVFADSLVI
jgi:hypothetical protein